MSPNHIRAIRETFALVAMRPEAAAQLFYDRLFDLDPTLRSLFHADLKEQGRKLMQMLGAAIRLLEQPAALVPVLENLGRRHVDYGVQDGHYDTVGEALLWTLKSALGEEFTEEAEEAWSDLYTTIASIMKLASRQTMAAAR
jgi:hemoglobin-like flavoprotein